MTTAINFMDYVNHTVKGKEVLHAFERTHRVYNYLKAHKGEKFSPTEIAEELYKWGNYQATARELHILEKMGLVGREAYTKTIHIDCGGYYKLVSKVFEGINFTAKVLVHEPFDKEVTLYRWYAL